MKVQIETQKIRRHQSFSRSWLNTFYTGVLILFLLLPQLVSAMTLSEALQLAVKHDPAVPFSLATFEADKQRGDQVSGTLLPSVSASGTLFQHRNKNESQFFGSFRESFLDYGAGITARQPVYRFDWSARKEQAAVLDEQAALSQKGRQLNFLLRVAQRYFSVLLAQQEIALAEAEMRATAETLADTQKRFDVGLIPGTDLKEARARQDLAQARVLVARQQVASARDALQETTGKGDASMPVLPDDQSLPALTPKDMQSWVAKSVADNPDVLLATQEVAFAKSEVSQARGDIMPKVDAVASYRHFDASESRIGSERDEAQIGLELEVPIYAGGIGRSRIREAEARLEAATANARRIRNEAERLTRQQFRALQSLYVQERALAVSVTSAQAAETATRNGYEAGSRTIVDVLNARRAVISAQRDYGNTRYNILLGWLQLRHLTAGLGAEDFKQVDGLLKRIVHQNKTQESPS